MADRDALVDTTLWWQDRSRRGIVAGPGPTGTRLRAAGVVEEIRAARDRVAEQQAWPESEVAH